jgi:hypothetical protein
VFLGPEPAVRRIRSEEAPDSIDLDRLTLVCDSLTAFRFMAGKKCAPGTRFSYSALLRLCSLALTLSCVFSAHY